MKQPLLKASYAGYIHIKKAALKAAYPNSFYLSIIFSPTPDQGRQENRRPLIAQTLCQALVP